jgi:phage repressor protein C with HTH and peptisase S24 domain
MDTLATRLLEARTDAGMTQAELARAAKLRNQSIIGALEASTRKDSTHIPAIAAALGVSALWLSRGIGQKKERDARGATVLDGNDQARAARVRQSREKRGLSTADVAKALTLPETVILDIESGARGYASHFSALASVLRVDSIWLLLGQTSPGMVRYTMYDDVRARCGPGETPPDYEPKNATTLLLSEEDSFRIVGRASNPDNRIQIIRAAGDSMLPTIAPGNFLFVDTEQPEFTGPGLYVLHQDGPICKRLSRVGPDIIVKSDNPLYDPYPWAPGSETDRIIGPVVKVMSF